MAYKFVEKIYRDENLISIEEIQEEIYYYVPVFFEDEVEDDVFDFDEVEDNED